MNKFFLLFGLISFFAFSSCTPEQKDTAHEITAKKTDTVIVDCNYSFEEAIEGSKAPKSILKQLKLIDVQYYSTDGKIHAGQVLTNEKLVDDLVHLFKFMLQEHFPIAQVIPIVKYNWDDNLSMLANNSSSFCYRDVSFSKHASGMAIDINPYFNPVRWKAPYLHRHNKPAGAVYNPRVLGTFRYSHPVVLEFQKYGFRWGHTFKRNFDDHHFEKKISELLV